MMVDALVAARLRIDQVMMTYRQYFLPISCVLLVGVCLWLLMVPAWLAVITRYVLAIGTMSGLVGVVRQRVLRPPRCRRRRVISRASGSGGDALLGGENDAAPPPLSSSSHSSWCAYFTP